MNIMNKGRKIMTREEIEKKVYFAQTVIGAIKNVKHPMLIYDEEKEVVREALSKYIRELEDELRGK